MVRESLVGRDFPGDRHRVRRHSAMRVERIGREPSPDHEAVGGGSPDAMPRLNGWRAISIARE